MQARKLSKSDIQLVSGLLNNDITRHCFNYENPWYLTDRYASNFSLLLELSEKKAMIESFEYARNFPIEEARKKFSENS